MSDTTRYWDSVPDAGWDRLIKAVNAAESDFEADQDDAFRRGYEAGFTDAYLDLK